MLAARAASHGRLVAYQPTASAARRCRECYPILLPCTFKCSRALSTQPKKIASRKNEIAEESQDEREPWMTQKTALKSKFGEEGWQPRKRLSPDAIEGIRSLHSQDPETYTTPYLANHFEVSAEAIRRILKSKWRPSPGEDLNRRERWERRGQTIWSHWAELGFDPPKKWKAGIAANNQTPTPSETNTATTRARKPKGGNGGDSSLSSRIL